MLKMKKIYPLFFVFLFLGPLVHGQGLILLDADGNDITGDTLYVHGDAHANLIKGDLFFHNDSDEDMQVMVRKVEVDILEGTFNAFCWDDYCFSPEVYESPDPIILPPGETSSDTDFYLEYYPQGQVGISIIDYEFFSRNDAFEEVIATVVFETTDPTSVTEADANGVYLSSPHPNPANSQTMFRYSLPHGSGEALLEVYSVTGSLLKRVSLPAGGQSIYLDTSDLPGGMSFYSLLVDGRQMASGKLIIQ